MSQTSVDRNLLCGILALQMGFLDREQLVAGMNAWLEDRDKPLSQVFFERKSLSEDTHALLVALVERHIALHGNDPQKSLAALSSLGSAKEDLKNLADAEVQASLGHVGTFREHDPYATLAEPAPGRPAVVGESTSGGRRFRVLRPHARGGLGQVLVARDDELHREVALKELQDRHADDAASRSRFVVEAEITGRLEHPGIVPVYGLGHYADGRPFYVMRFIHGDSLDEAIARFHRAPALRGRAERSVEFRQLLGRFVDVCNAIEYAHSRGVLHRDLKPGNIMLGQYGETLVVDWGLAKPYGESSSEAAASEVRLTPVSGSGSAATQMGSAIGTPAYMSPEQAAGRLDQLSAASDIYSLGATLYCLLAGRPPVSDRDLRVVLDKVQAGEFPRPRQIKPEVAKALEAICLKAMSLAPQARYPSARELADEVERWLADEPVIAYAEPWFIQLRRWVSRHRTLVTGATAALLVALLSLTASVALLTAANERERAAKDLAIANQREAERQRSRAEENLREVERQRERAEKNFATARQAVDEYLTRVSESPRLQAHGLEVLRRELLETALKFYEQFSREKSQDPGIEAERGRALLRVGSINANLGSNDKAIATYRDAVALFDALVANGPDNAEPRHWAAGSRLALAERLLGGMHLQEAESPLREATAALEQLTQAHPKMAAAWQSLAEAYTNEAEFQRSSSRLEDAERAAQKAVDVYRRLLSEHPGTPGYQQELARRLLDFAQLHAAEGWQFQKAEQPLQEAVDLARQVVERQPDDPVARSLSVRARRQLAAWLVTQVRIAEGEEMARAAAEEAERLIAKHPDVPAYEGQLADILVVLCHLQRALLKWQDAEKTILRGQTLCEQLSTRYPTQLEYQVALAICQSALGQIHYYNRQYEKAEQVERSTIKILEPLLANERPAIDHVFSLAESYALLGHVLIRLKRADEALAMYDKSVEKYSLILRQSPEHAYARFSLADVYAERAMLYESRKRFPEAIADYDRVGELAEQTGAYKSDRKRDHPLLKAISLNYKMLRSVDINELRSYLFDLVQRGEYDQAIGDATRLCELVGDRDDLFLAACVCAKSAQGVTQKNGQTDEKRRELSDRYAAKSVEFLQKSWDAGAFDNVTSLLGLFRDRASLKRIKQGPEFQVLQSRADFQSLLKRIESAAETQKAKGR